MHTKLLIDPNHVCKDHKKKSSRAFSNCGSLKIFSQVGRSFEQLWYRPKISVPFTWSNTRIFKWVHGILNTLFLHQLQVSCLAQHQNSKHFHFSSRYWIYKMYFQTIRDWKVDMDSTQCLKLGEIKITHNDEYMHILTLVPVDRKRVFNFIQKSERKSVVIKLHFLHIFKNWALKNLILRRRALKVLHKKKSKHQKGSEFCRKRRKTSQLNINDCKQLVRAVLFPSNWICWQLMIHADGSLLLKFMEARYRTVLGESRVYSTRNNENSKNRRFRLT